MGFVVSVLSYKICGSGCPIKLKCLSQFIRNETLDICLLQETKVWEVNEKLVLKLWGDQRLSGHLKGHVAD